MLAIYFIDINIKKCYFNYTKRCFRKANGPPWLSVTYQKSNLLLWRAAVAFLMSMFLFRLCDTDTGHYDTDNGNHNTDNSNNCIKHLFCTFHVIFQCITSGIQEVLKMYSFWQKVNRLPFWKHHYKYNICIQKSKYI